MNSIRLWESRFGFPIACAMITIESEVLVNQSELKNQHPVIITAAVSTNMRQTKSEGK